MPSMLSCVHVGSNHSAAGVQAVDDYVESGMVVGLGTGSTAAFAVERVGEKLKSGELKDIIAVPTSIRTKEQECATLSLYLAKTPILGGVSSIWSSALPKQCYKLRAFPLPSAYFLDVCCMLAACLLHACCILVADLLCACVRICGHGMHSFLGRGTGHPAGDAGHAL